MCQDKTGDVLFLTETKGEWTLGTCCQPWPYPNLCRGPNPGKAPLILLLLLSEISHVFFTYQTPTLPIKSSSNDPLTVQTLRAICAEGCGGSAEPLSSGESSVRFFR